MGSTFFWPMDMDLLGSPSLISYFILFSLHIQFLYCNVILHLDYRITLAAGVVLCKITFVMLISSGVTKDKLHNFNYYF